MTPRMALARLAQAGLRVSFGMQSTVRVSCDPGSRILPSVLPLVVESGRRRLACRRRWIPIYGTPGRASLDWERPCVQLYHETDSAYALVVEEGTKIGSHGGQGRVPDPDDEAAKYELADDLGGAGYAWYEISELCARHRGPCRGGPSAFWARLLP